MEIGEYLKQTLAAVCPNLFPGRAPDDNTLTTYGVYTHYSGPIVEDLQGTSDQQREVVQLDLYTPTYLELQQLQRAVSQRLGEFCSAAVLYGSPTTFSSRQVSRQYFGVDPDVNLHRQLLEFAVWYIP